MGTGIGKYCKRCGEQLNYDDGFENGFCSKCSHILELNDKENWKESIKEVLDGKSIYLREGMTKQEVIEWIVETELDNLEQLLSEKMFTNNELEIIDWYLNEYGREEGVDKEADKLREKVSKLLKKKNGI